MKNYDLKNVIIENKNMIHYLKYIIDKNIEKTHVDIDRITSYNTPLLYPKEHLAKIRNLNFILNDNIEDNEMLDFLDEFKELIERDICLENFTFGLKSTKGWALANAKYILNSVTDQIKTMNLKSVSLKNLNKNYFKNKNNLEMLKINDCIDINLDILKNTNFKTMINIVNCNELLDSNEFLQWAITTPNPIITDRKDINDVIELFKPNQLNELNNNVHKIDVSSFIEHIDFINKNIDLIFNKKMSLVSNDFYINVNKKLNFKNLCTINEYGNAFLSKAKENNKNIFLIGTPDNVSNVLETSFNTKSMLIVDKLKDVSIFKFKRLNASHVSLNTRYGSGYQKTFYTMKDMTLIKKRIDQIERKVRPLLLKNMSQKEIFTRLYLELGKTIEYDKELASELELGFPHERLYGSQNLKNGLLMNLSVCAGISDIIEKICTDFGIEADIIGTNGKDAHAWNRVKLDGKYYFTDLTWDMYDIKQNNYPLKYFLKSASDFGHKQYIENPDCFESQFDINNAQCYTTIKDVEQLQLIKKVSSPEMLQIARQQITNLKSHQSKQNEHDIQNRQNNKLNENKEIDSFEK